VGDVIGHRVRLPVETLAVGVGVLVAAEVGAAVALKPILAMLPIVALAGVLLAVDARARLMFVVFGGILTLQSSDSFGHLKLVYMAGILAASGGAMISFSRSQDRPRRALAMPLLRASVVLGALVVISYFVAKGNGVARPDWIRDVAPYLLFALTPLFALDAQSLRRRTLVLILLGAASIAALSFATRFIEQRHIANLPFQRFALTSFFLPAALFAYASAAALQSGEKRTRWLAVAAALFALLIVSGTRTTLILALAPVFAAVGARRYLGARVVRLALLTPLVVLLMGGAVYSVVAATHASTTVITKRVTLLRHTGTSSDASYRDRQAQANAARDVFYSHPFYGAGPGTYFEWRVTDGTSESAFIIDSPMDFPAKFGALGLVTLGFLALSYGSFLRRVFRFNHPRTETLALAAYFSVIVAGSFIDNPLEDKGCALGLILLLALVLRTHEASPPSAGRIRAY
jgi:hypothetical protein